MFVIKRVDKEYGNFSETHPTLCVAIAEARRLVEKHAKDNPIFYIYKLEGMRVVKSRIEVVVDYLKSDDK